MSVPDFSGPVLRAETCTVTFLAVTGEVATMNLSGLESVLVQHEVDHLDGRVYVQYLSKTKRDFIRKKLARLK